MAGFRGNAKQLRRRSDSRCSWRRIANHSRLSAAAASDSASCSIMSGKRGATWRREPTYPGEDRRSAADPDRWDDLGESNENAIDWFARARCSTTWRGGGNSSGRPSVYGPRIQARPGLPASLRPPRVAHRPLRTGAAGSTSSVVCVELEVSPPERHSTTDACNTHETTADCTPGPRRQPERRLYPCTMSGAPPASVSARR